MSGLLEPGWVGDGVSAESVNDSPPSAEGKDESSELLPSVERLEKSTDVLHSPWKQGISFNAQPKLAISHSKNFHIRSSARQSSAEDLFSKPQQISAPVFSHDDADDPLRMASYLPPQSEMCPSQSVKQRSHSSSARHALISKVQDVDRAPEGGVASLPVSMTPALKTTPDDARRWTRRNFANSIEDPLGVFFVTPHLSALGVA